MHTFYIKYMQFGITYFKTLQIKKFLIQSDTE